MNKFKPYQCLESQLSSLPIIDGQLILTTDTNQIYADINNERKLYSSSSSDNVVFEWSGESSVYDDTVLPVWQKIIDTVREGKNVLVVSSVVDESMFTANKNAFLLVLNKASITAGQSNYLIWNSCYNISNRIYTTKGYALGRYFMFTQVTIDSSYQVTDVTQLIESKDETFACYLPTDKQDVTDYTPTYDYHPATKKYVDDRLAEYDQTLTDIESILATLASPAEV